MHSTCRNKMFETHFSVYKALLNSFQLHFLSTGLSRSHSPHHRWTPQNCLVCASHPAFPACYRCEHYLSRAAHPSCPSFPAHLSGSSSKPSISHLLSQTVFGLLRQTIHPILWRQDSGFFSPVRKVSQPNLARYAEYFGSPTHSSHPCPPTQTNYSFSK